MQMPSARPTDSWLLPYGFSHVAKQGLAVALYVYVLFSMLHHGPALPIAVLGDYEVLLTMSVLTAAAAVINPKRRHTVGKVTNSATTNK